MDKLIEGLYLHFLCIYGDKFSHNHSDLLIKIWKEEWASGLENLRPNSIKDAIDYCRKNVEWPPCIAEFRKICEIAEGFPSIDEILLLMIRRDFAHPFTKLMFDKIGSWELSHGKEKDLKRQIKELYPELLAQYRTQPKGKLECDQSKTPKLSLVR